jgi:PAS domain S-box-containing protein
MEGETMFRDLAEQCPVGVFLFQDGELRYVNPKLAAMHGYTVDEVARVKRTDLVHLDDLPRLEEHISKQLSGEPMPMKLIFRGITKNGGIVHIENHDCRLTSSHGHAAIIGTAVDVTERQKTEEELRGYREQLEELVKERTSQLLDLNRELRRDIQKRVEIEKAFQIKSLNLEEANTALKVLIKQREDDRRELEESLASNVKELVLRFIRMLRETRLDTNQALLVDIVEQNLRDIISTFPKRMNTFGFTPKEMEVIFLVREGTTTKQIAQLLHVSMDAVSRHRYHIRKKLGVNKKRSNLRSHLMSLE